MSAELRGACICWRARLICVCLLQAVLLTVWARTLGSAACSGCTSLRCRTRIHCLSVRSMPLAEKSRS